jgi:hypothetical protein
LKTRGKNRAGEIEGWREGGREGGGEGGRGEKKFTRQKSEG